jgi:hypothetical protein
MDDAQKTAKKRTPDEKDRQSFDVFEGLIAMEHLDFLCILEGLLIS